MSEISAITAIIIKGLARISEDAAHHLGVMAEEITLHNNGPAAADDDQQVAPDPVHMQHDAEAQNYPEPPFIPPPSVGLPSDDVYGADHAEEEGNDSDSETTSSSGHKNNDNSDVRRDIIKVFEASPNECFSSNDINELLGNPMTGPAILHHLKRLVKSGEIKERKKLGRSRMFQLTP